MSSHKRDFSGIVRMYKIQPARCYLDCIDLNTYMDEDGFCENMARSKCFQSGNLHPPGVNRNCFFKEASSSKSISIFSFDDIYIYHRKKCIDIFLL